MWDTPWAFVPIFLVLAAIFLVYPNIGFSDFVGLILLLPVFGALAATPKFKTAVLLHRGVQEIELFGRVPVPARMTIPWGR